MHGKDFWKWNWWNFSDYDSEFIYTKIDLMSLCVKASNMGILKLGAGKELSCRHLSWKEKWGPVHMSTVSWAEWEKE